MTIKYPEHILSVVRDHITLGLGAVQGINQNISAEIFYGNDINKNLVVSRRHELETNELYLQVLPYTVLLKGDPSDLKNARVVLYQRGKGTGEARLAGGHSIGFGGHVDLADIVSEKNTINLKETVQINAIRELDEEAVFSVGLGHNVPPHDNPEIFKLHWYGLLTDRSNAVGRVHVGVINLVFLPNDINVFDKEAELRIVGEATPGQLLAEQYPEGQGLENWSKILLESFVAETVAA